MVSSTYGVLAMPKKSATQPTKIPEDALAAVFLELWEAEQEDAPWSAKALRAAGRSYRSESFTGKNDVLAKVIGTMCDNWAGKGWLKKTSRNQYSPTDDGLIEMRKMLPEWITEAAELVDRYGESLMSEGYWVEVIRTASRSDIQKVCFDKVFLPWLQHDNFWLLKPNDPEGRSVNRRGILAKKIPCEGFD